MAVSLSSTVYFHSLNTRKSFKLGLPRSFSFASSTNFTFKTLFETQACYHIGKNATYLSPVCCVSVKCLSAAPVRRKNYEFSDCVAEVELKLPLEGRDVQSRDVFVDVKESFLAVKLQTSEASMSILETALYEKIKPSEAIWYIDEDHLVVNLKKLDTDIKWPDITETWESLKVGVMQLLKGTSIYIVGESTENNQKVARELAVGLGYTPLNTGELLETFAEKSIDSWVISEGVDAVAEAEAAVLESLSSHVRTAVGTLGGSYGAAVRPDKWRHLHAGFTIWVSQSEATDEASAKVEAQRSILDGNKGYAKADVIVKLSRWDPEYIQTIAKSCLSGLKQLIISDKKLPGKKSLYIRLGCRGDWPNIKPPGWDPSSGLDVSSDA
ncbi:probable inactive shikimate kinase like 2, chloroplastic [Aristolochia californica]|uniref:probable inactive shikimate kinase like 2, chloroplastic n=1 Tax=Aristolochia californica TaxID=171875 RepID=UPI0035DBCEB8